MTEVGKSRSYRDPEVWKRSIALVKDIYAATSQFSPAENFGLIKQIRRAAVSIPSNVAEGQFRNSPKAFRQFLPIALGSAAELETQVIIANQAGYLSSQMLIHV